MKQYRAFVLIIVLFLIGITVFTLIRFHDGQLHVTICDVGQGDAVFLRTPAGHEILFDAGPDAKVLECLANEMPFWDKSIDLLILSHPHADHLNGFLDVLNVYQVDQFITEDLENKSDGFSALKEKVGAKKINWQTVLKGDKLRTSDGVSLTILGPTRDYLQQTAVNGKYITSSEFASMEVLVSYHDFDVLLTGDSQAAQLGAMLQSTRLPQIDVLQVPHHGSRTGLSDEIMRLLRPSLSTISVGKKNTYGHPSPFTLSLLQNYRSTILRTDQKGNLRLKSDGKSYNVENDLL